jgi:hypothetical protein
MSSPSIAECSKTLVSARVPYHELKLLVSAEIVRLALERNHGVYNRVWIAIDCAAKNLREIERRRPAPSQPQMLPVITQLAQLLLDEMKLYAPAMARFTREIAAAAVREAGSGRAAAPLLQVHRNFVPRMLRSEPARRGYPKEDCA